MAKKSASITTCIHFVHQAILTEKAWLQSIMCLYCVRECVSTYVRNISKTIDLKWRNNFHQLHPSHQAEMETDATISSLKTRTQSNEEEKNL